MSSVALADVVSTTFPRELDSFVERIAKVLLLEVVVTANVPKRDKAENVRGAPQRRGRAIDFQVKGYAPLGDRPLEEVFGKIIKLHDQIFRDAVTKDRCLQLTYCPGAKPHIQIGVRPKAPVSQVAGDRK